MATSLENVDPIFSGQTSSPSELRLEDIDPIFRDTPRLSGGVAEPAAEAPTDFGPAAATMGAAAGYGASKLFPIQTENVRAQTAVAGAEAKAQEFRNQLAAEAARTNAERAPFLAERAAAANATDAARMEMARNEMLFKHAYQRALDMGIDPKDFLKSPETFVRATSPETRYGTKNWIASEYGNVNPLAVKDVVTKEEVKPLLQELAARGEQATQVAGRHIQQPSGIYTSAGRGGDPTRAALTTANIEKTLLDAQRQYEELAAIQKGLPELPEGSPQAKSLMGKLSTAEANLADQVARLKEIEAAQPGALDRVAKFLSGPKVSAGLAAIGGLELARIPEALRNEEYGKALLHGMGGLGGVALMSPNPYAKAAALPLLAIPAAYEYGPRAYEAVRQGYDQFFPAKK